jgi:hypothetical protein
MRKHVSCLAAVLLSLTHLAPGPFAQTAPPNDAFADRLQLSGTNVQVPGSNVGATSEPGEPPHAGQPARRSVWYEWQAPHDGMAILNLIPSGDRLRAAVYTGDSYENLIEVASFAGRTNSFFAAKGETYLLAIDEQRANLATSFTLVLSHTDTVAIAPYAHTQAPAPVTGDSAVLNGMATANAVEAAAWFEWWSDNGQTNSTEATIVSGLKVVRVSAKVEGLAPGEVYTCRLIVSNQAGVARAHPHRFTTGGRVSSWGISWYGRVLPPPDLNDVVAVAAGEYHGLAIRNDGRLAVWGYYQGRPPDPAEPPPPNLGPVIAAAGGAAHTVAVTADGRVVAWGDNSQKQIEVPAGLSNVIAVAASDRHSLALRSDGTVAAWGSTRQPPDGLRNVVAIACGDLNNLVLRHDGTLVQWNMDWGQVPLPPAGLTNVVSIAASWLHNMALKSDGTLVGWREANAAPQLIEVPPAVSGVLALAAGDDHTIALLDDGTVAVWGVQTSYESLFVPTGLTGAVGIASGDQFCLALGPNTPPQLIASTNWVDRQSGGLVTAPCYEPNGDPMRIIVSRLPQLGTIHQYDDGQVGDAITETGTLVTEPRVFFLPHQLHDSIAYDTVGFAANDGQYDSEGEVKVNIVAAPTIDPASIAPLPHGGIRFTFSGLAGFPYRVQRSSELIWWSATSRLSEPSPGSFVVEYDPQGDRAPRFFRISLP